MKSPCKIWYTQHHLRSISQEFELGLFNNSGFTTKNSVGLCQEATKNKSRMIVNVATAAVIFCILKSIQKVFVVCIEMAFYKKNDAFDLLLYYRATHKHTNNHHLSIYTQRCDLVQNAEAAVRKVLEEDYKCFFGS